MAPNPRRQLQQFISPSALRSYLAEFISTFLFVFVAVGSAMSASIPSLPLSQKMVFPEHLTLDWTFLLLKGKAAPPDATTLVAISLAQGLSLFAAVYIAANSSGGHVNPAVTFALAISGQIAVPTAIIYWISQMLGSTLACLLLHVATADQVKKKDNKIFYLAKLTFWVLQFQAIPTTGIAPEMTGFGGAILEGVITFALVFTVFVAGDPRNKTAPLGVLGPLAIGLVAGSGVLAVGSFTGGSMNPARSFGPALVSGNFKNHGVYWVGPLAGAAIATLFYQYLIFPPPDPESSHGVVEAVVL